MNFKVTEKSDFDINMSFTSTVLSTSGLVGEKREDVSEVPIAGCDTIRLTNPSGPLMLTNVFINNGFSALYIFWTEKFP